MLREFVIICAAAIICNSPLHIAAKNASAESILPAAASTTVKADQSVTVQPQDNLALPSESSYQSVVHQIVKYIPSPSRSYEANASVVKTLPGNVPVASSSVSFQSYGSGYANQPVYSTIVASDPAAPENNNILETNVSNVQPIRAYYSVPVAAKTLNVNRATTNAADTVYINNIDPAVRKYYTVPVGKTVKAFESVNVNTPAKYLIYSPSVNPAVANANNAAPPNQYYNIPIAENKVSIESHGEFNVHPPTSYAGEQIQSKVVLAAQSPALVKYSVNHGSVAQYVSAPRVAYAANPVPAPVTSKTIAVEEFNSATAHPRPSPTYATGPVLIRYAPAPIPVAKPVPVPVIYPASAVESNYPAAQQFAAPTASTHVQAPMAQPVLVKLGKGAVRYNTIPIPRVHAESFIEKVYTPVGPAPVSSVRSGNSYAKAVVFSPASEVSRVSFNGFGASYGW